ncbi:hypothetical protein J437_LFUL013647 [Ladona fulva]|uniref:Protein kinase domain-containing protein n=1 Tax=Ladona fulva TaxID=123851 RepID=A0A8K0P606_LADFU|nr:hypothetical protein J437_LFUL013647 [Ladona fulva]
MQLTIEHDPDALPRRRPSFPCNIPPVNIMGPPPPPTHGLSRSTPVKTRGEVGPEKERMFARRRDEGYISGSRSSHRQLRRGKGSQERSSSMSRLLDGSPTSNRDTCDLSRTHSFRVEPTKSQRIFRASDLVKGELLGKGFFGQVYKVTHRDTSEVMVLKELYRVDEEAQRNFLKELEMDSTLYLFSRLDMSSDLMSLHLGDRILEVNGTPVKDQPIEHIENIIRYSDTVLQDKTVVVADFGLARIISQSGGLGGSPAGASDRRRYGKQICGRKRCERKKRYTVVGNPYWMAPEMMKGKKYDEKVDIFSFGIVLCEIIGRVHADPDFLPRSSDFGLNQNVFREKFCSECPEPFFRIAFHCCDLNPDKRPPFEVMEVWLEGLAMHLSVGADMPYDLEYDILHYTGPANRSASSSESTTPEALTPEAHRSLPAAAPLRPIKEGSMIARGEGRGNNTKLSQTPTIRPPSPVESTAL